MRRRALLAGGLALAGCGSRARLDALAAAGEARAVQALAGDGLRLDDGREVKLAGIEAPSGDQPHAAEARAELARRAQGRRVQLLSDGAPPDAQGRTVAHVRVRDGDWLEGALLSTGSARVRLSHGDRALASDMLSLEALARARRRGLWALDAYRVQLPSELQPWVTGLQIVEGRITRAGLTRDLAYLDFSRDWRDVASAEIPRAALRDFAAAGLDPQALQGRLVRVRGDAQALRIRLETPEAVEVLRS